MTGMRRDTLRTDKNVRREEWRTTVRKGKVSDRRNLTLVPTTMCVLDSKAHHWIWREA